MPFKRFFRNWHEFHAADFRLMLTSPDSKPLIKQAVEATTLFWRYGYPPMQYLHSGLYLRNAPPAWREHLPPALIRRLRSRLNPAEAHVFALDKQRFRARLEEAGLPIVREVLTVDRSGIVRDAEGRVLEIDAAAALLQDGEFFAKPIDGLHGKGARLIGPGDEVRGFLASTRNFIVQPRIRQHPLLKKLYPHAVNTVRIDTLWDGAKWVHNTAVLRLGRGNNIVDNGAAGGILVGIDLETGALRATGRQKPKFNTGLYDRHPDTGVVFKDVVLPHWGLLRETVARGADAMRPLLCLGWDVAITEEGVLLVEANHNWDVNVSQGGWGGLADTPIGRMARELQGLKPAGKAA